MYKKITEAEESTKVMLRNSITNWELGTKQRFYKCPSQHLQLTNTPFQRKGTGEPLQLYKLKLNGEEVDLTTSMTATLDPKNPPGVGQSSTIDKDLDAIMSKLPTKVKLHDPHKFVKGHLLNEQLGGMANKSNLFPITAAANANHKNEIETDVKDYVGEGDGGPIKYSVNVTNISVAMTTGKMYPTAPDSQIEMPKAKFECTVTGSKDYKGARKKIIESEYGVD